MASELDAASDVRQQTAEPQNHRHQRFSKGGEAGRLQAFEWPKRVHVVLRPLVVKRTTNAFAQLLASEEQSPASELRVRVVNAADSKEEQFSWPGRAKGPNCRRQ